MNHLGNYMDSSKEGLAYQMEYIFAGKDEDMDNLKSVASKLCLSEREKLCLPDG